MKLCTTVRDGWKFWSVRFAAIPAAIIAFLVANPDQMIAVAALFTGLMPDGPMRWVIGVGLGLGSWAIPTFIRLLKQDNCDDDKETA